MDIFWKKGYEQTSMSDLLEHMSIQRQSFYNTFGSKEKIFIEAITLYTNTIYTEYSTLLDRPGNPIENVRDMLQLWETRVKEYGDCGCMLGNSIAEFAAINPDITALLKHKIQRLEDMFYRTFERAVQEGYLPDTSDARALARTFIVVSQGIALISKLGIGTDMLPAVMTTAQVLLKK